MVDLKSKVALVIDHGYFMELAITLSKSFGEVIYSPPWHAYNPTPDRAVVGQNIPGLIYAEEFMQHVDRADVIVFFDVGLYAYAEYFRKHGKRVFSMFGAEKLELDRVFAKSVQERLKMPMPKYQTVYGVDELRAALQKEDDVWVKIDSKWRGIKETWHHETYKSSEHIIDYLAHKLGVLRNTFTFVLEKSWPGVEAGCDYFVSSGNYLPVGTFGYEAKDEGYICKVVKLADLPKPIKEANDKIAEYYKEDLPCGMASTEDRVNEKGEGYRLDFTQRAGSPPAEIISELYTNFAEIVWCCAGGEMVEPKAKAKYAAQIILTSALASCEPVAVDFPEGAESNIKLRRMCYIDGQRFVVPIDDDDHIGAVVGFGNTLIDAENEALKYLDMVLCRELSYNDSVFDDLDETLEAAEECGLGRF